jgi:hypothetical protein
MLENMSHSEAKDKCLSCCATQKRRTEAIFAVKTVLGLFLRENLELFIVTLKLEFWLRVKYK